MRELKEQNTELELLIENTQRLTVLDATLTIQNEHLPEICSHVDTTKDHLASLGKKLDQCLNSLPLGKDVMVSDPGRLQTQIAEVASKLKQANVLMESDVKLNESIQAKLVELRRLLTQKHTSLVE